MAPRFASGGRRSSTERFVSTAEIFQAMVAEQDQAIDTWMRRQARSPDWGPLLVGGGNVVMAMTE